jgi:hypothetical protein
MFSAFLCGLCERMIFLLLGNDPLSPQETDVGIAWEKEREQGAPGMILRRVSLNGPEKIRIQRGRWNGLILRNHLDLNLFSHPLPNLLQEGFLRSAWDQAAIERRSRFGGNEVGLRSRWAAMTSLISSLSFVPKTLPRYLVSSFMIHA